MRYYPKIFDEANQASKDLTQVSHYFDCLGQHCRSKDVGDANMTMVGIRTSAVCSWIECTAWRVAFAIWAVAEIVS